MSVLQMHPDLEEVSVLMQPSPVQEITRSCDREGRWLYIVNFHTTSHTRERGKVAPSDRCRCLDHNDLGPSAQGKPSVTISRERGENSPRISCVPTLPRTHPPEYRFPWPLFSLLRWGCLLRAPPPQTQTNKIKSPRLTSVGR